MRVESWRNSLHVQWALLRMCEGKIKNAPRCDPKSTAHWWGRCVKHWPRYVADWRNDTAAMSFEEQGAYSALLDTYDANEGPLPTDKHAIYRLTGAMNKKDQAAILAVEKSLSEAEWDNVVVLSQDDFEVQPEWKDQLQQAVEAFELDVSGMQPGWFLVCLYF